MIILLFCLIGNLFFVWITYFDLKETGTEIVKCYDRYGNEIIGEECIDENEPAPLCACGCVKKETRSKLLPYKNK